MLIGGVLPRLAVHAVVTEQRAACQTQARAQRRLLGRGAHVAGHARKHVHVRMRERNQMRDGRGLGEERACERRRGRGGHPRGQLWYVRVVELGLWS